MSWLYNCLLHDCDLLLTSVPSVELQAPGNGVRTVQALKVQFFHPLNINLAHASLKPGNLKLELQEAAFKRKKMK